MYGARKAKSWNIFHIALTIFECEFFSLIINCFHSSLAVEKHKI